MKIEINLPERGWLSRRLQRRFLSWVTIPWDEGRRISLWVGMRSLYYGHRSHTSRVRELEDRVTAAEEALVAGGLMRQAGAGVHAHVVPLDGQPPGGGGDDDDGAGCAAGGAAGGR